jgi:hypothetical protein
MHERQRTHLEKQTLVLQLAAFDMQQADAAAQAMLAEQSDLPLRLALETAMVVCYARAFTKS